MGTKRVGHGNCLVGALQVKVVRDVIPREPNTPLIRNIPEIIGALLL